MIASILLIKQNDLSRQNGNHRVAEEMTQMTDDNVTTGKVTTSMADVEINTKI